MSDEHSDSQALSQVLASANDALRSGGTAAGRVWPTGFDPLDGYLGGGLRSRELALVGGPQGLGKTTFVSQILRNVVADGHVGIMFSFEHDTTTLLERFVALEAGVQHGLEGVRIKRVREALEGGDSGGGGLSDRLASTVGGQDAAKAVENYGSRLFLHRSHGGTTTLAVIKAEVEAVQALTGEAPLVIVDYLQKVADPSASSEEQQVTNVVEGLKDLALDYDCPVVAIVASDMEGIVTGKRMRVHHLRGSSALAYEADVILALNNKFDVVARHHLVYDAGNASRFRDYVVCSIEKNRTGLDSIDLEFRKRFEQARFETDGAAVSEQLVDARVFVE